jgi:hypothetical protein
MITSSSAPLPRKHSVVPVEPRPANLRNTNITTIQHWMLSSLAVAPQLVGDPLELLDLRWPGFCAHSN